jgi:hypothetical protein
MVFSLYHNFTIKLSQLAGKKYFWIALLGLLFFPFITLIFFNHASADDYCYVVGTVKMGFWKYQIDIYRNWSGRYVSNILLAGGPLLFCSFVGYKLINFLLLLFTAASWLYFVKALLHKSNFDLSVIAISTGMLFLYLSKMPNLTEGFYWLAGALTYQLPNLATLVLLTLLLNMKREYTMSKLIAALVLCVFICGGNETSMLEFIYVLIAMMIFEYASTYEIPKYYYVLLSVALVAGSFATSAPGNYIRAGYFQGEKNIFIAFELAVGSALSKLGAWLPDVLILLLLLLPFLKNLETSGSDQRKITPVILILYPFFIVGILIVGFFPAYWSVGFESPTRTTNVLYWLFLVSSLHFTVLVITYLKQKDSPLAAVPAYVQWILIFIFLRNWVPQNHFRTASMDLISGRAMTYDREMQERYLAMEKNKGRDVMLKPLTSKPKSIFLSDIEPGHPEDWENTCTANYFYLKSLDLSKPQ